MTKNKFDKESYSRSNSSFMQIINFKHNGKPLVGYSNKPGFYEKNDKVAVLFNWIMRMYKSGYLDRTVGGVDEITNIEYYDLRQDRYAPPLMFTMYYTAAMWDPKYINVDMEPLMKLLDSFFECVVYQQKQLEQLHRKGEPEYLLIEKNEEMRRKIFDKLYITARTKKAPEEEVFQIKKKTIASPRQLAEMVLILKNEGWPPERVDNWARAYSKKYFENIKL